MDSILTLSKECPKNAIHRIERYFKELDKLIFAAETGNFGNEGSDYRHLLGGIWELKIDYGPGYRVYFGLENDSIILLLLAGSKKSQSKDIENAKKFWSEFKSREIEK